jgi:hypothetical protein
MKGEVFMELEHKLIIQQEYKYIVTYLGYFFWHQLVTCPDICDK